MEKDAKLITVGPTFIPDSRVHFDWCVTAGKIENIHLPMQIGRDIRKQVDIFRYLMYF